MAAETSVGERCDRLAAMTLLAACRGDVEASLGRTERLLALALRAPDRSWVRVAYALRAWLYFLAQQPGEAHAELDRALERPGNSLEACMALTLATTLGGSPQQVEQLRSIAASCRDPAMARIVAAAATGLEGAGEPAEHESSDWRGGPAFLTALVGLQVSARRHRGTAMLSGTTVAGADQLAELIVAAAQ